MDNNNEITNNVTDTAQDIISDVESDAAKLSNDENAAVLANNKVKYGLIALAAILIIAVILIMALGTNKSGNTNDTRNMTTSEESNDTAEEDNTVYTPTFKYFVSKNDSDYDSYMATIDELKSEYGDKVTWDIVDIDEHPEAKENFSVDNDTTPMLILTNTKNDISAMEFKCSDKNTLKADIDTAIGQ